MGKAIIKAAQSHTDCEIAAGVDKIIDSDTPFPTYESINNVKEKADVIIDFSHPSALDSILEYSEKTNTPAVLCTTGFSDEQVEKIKNASKTMPIFYSRNMSLGINLLIELAKKATEILERDFDIEIIEKHHNQKIDAPSGTALMIADAINTEANGKYEYVYDRTQVRQKRGAQELGISSIRGGGIVGEHDVLFCGPDEVLTLSHSAGSRGVFADGAVQAALYIAALAPGYYTMTDLLRGKLICE